jgi:glycosyltransferase involved in cell wall biosynthesis
VKLVIISHTEHYQKGNEVVGFGPTVREVNFVAKHFEKVVHVSLFFEGVEASGNAIAYSESNIQFVPLRPAGGKGLINKIDILVSIPRNLSIIHHAIKDADWVQLRLPHNIGLYLLPYFWMKSKPKRWVKYAGNWADPNPPLAYRIQRWMLRKNCHSGKVTVNGVWPGEPNHILSFENPSLTNEEMSHARACAERKRFDGKLRLLFAGRMDAQKGAGLILDAIKQFKNADVIFDEVIFAGDGKDYELLQQQAMGLKLKCTFTGMLTRKQLNEHYESAHLFVFPSSSEGFPKAVAEAAAFGCLPICSDVSALKQYFKDGFSARILKQTTADELVKAFSTLDHPDELKKMAMQASDVAALFSYERYIMRVKSEIIGENLSSETYIE